MTTTQKFPFHRKYLAYSTMVTRENIEMKDLYAHPNLLVCLEDPLDYTALNELGYDYYEDFLSGEPYYNRSIITWKGKKENLTYDQIFGLVYRQIDGIRVEGTSRKRFIPQLGNCIEFLPSNLARSNTIKIFLPPAESFVVQGRKFMSCSHCQEFGQQASWLLIGLH